MLVHHFNREYAEIVVVFGLVNHARTTDSLSPAFASLKAN
jgi:hypothetical protein